MPFAWIGNVILVVLVGQFLIGGGLAQGIAKPQAGSECLDLGRLSPNATAEIADSGNGACPQPFGPQFTTTTWTGSWNTVEQLIQPCGSGSYVTYPGNSPYTSNGSIPSYTKAYVNGDNSCSYIRDVAKVNLGLWGGGFYAWKPGYATYNVEANFTLTDSVSGATYTSPYCGSCGGYSQAIASVTANDAMYDDSTSSGVGVAAQVTIQNVTAYGPQDVVTNGDTSATFSVSFTSVSILNGDVLIPRASVTVYAWAYVLSSWPYASHAAGTTQTIVNGVSLVLDSIWVS